MNERKRNRFTGYDYSKPGAYFITIRIQRRVEWFGSVRSGVMVLNADGIIAHRCWMEIRDHFPGCRTDAFVVMPDHVHGIVVIGNEIAADPHDPVGGRHACPLPGRGGHRIRPNHALLPVIVGSYKSAVSKYVHRFGDASFTWQRSYYDRIIRDDRALWRVREYIWANPMRVADVT